MFPGLAPRATDMPSLSGLTTSYVARLYSGGTRAVTRDLHRGRSSPVRGDISVALAVRPGEEASHLGNAPYGGRHNSACRAPLGRPRDPSSSARLRTPRDHTEWCGAPPRLVVVPSCARGTGPAWTAATGWSGCSESRLSPTVAGGGGRPRLRALRAPRESRRGSPCNAPPPAPSSPVRSTPRRPAGAGPAGDSAPLRWR